MSPGHISNGPSESSGDIDDWHRFLLDSEAYLGGLVDVRCAKVAEDVVRVLGGPSTMQRWAACGAEHSCTVTLMHTYTMMPVYNLKLSLERIPIQNAGSLCP